MESEQQTDIIKIFHLEKELLGYLKKEQKEELSSLKRPRNKVVSIFESFISAFRNLGDEDPAKLEKVKLEKEKVIEELIKYFNKMKEDGSEDLLMKYLSSLNKERLNKLYGIELNKYNLKPKIEIYYTATDPNMLLNQNPLIYISYEPTKENLSGARQLISDVIVALERLKGNEPNKNKIN